MGTNWSRGSSVWAWGRTSLWGWRSPGLGCPGRLWIFLLWRYSRPAWTRSCATCCRWPCFGRRVGLDDPQRSLPTPNILWFCENKQVYTYICAYIWTPPSCAEPSGQPVGTGQGNSSLVVGGESAAQWGSCCVPGCEGAAVQGAAFHPRKCCA